MRLIDAEELKTIKSIQSADFNSIETIREWIDNAPIIVEFIEPINEVYVRGDKFEKVVRCKDCKFWQDNNGGYPNMNCRWFVDETPDADDFCSYGERKAEQI